MAHVSIKSISKSYEGLAKPKKRWFKKANNVINDDVSKNAVSNLSVEIPDGNFTVIIGPSGCGKSTTLRMIAGLETIDEGEIFINDKKINNLSPGNRNISMVFQSYALYPMMTVRQNITFGLENNKLPEEDINKRVSEVASIVGLEEFLDRNPSQLSGGQQQRVALARAIVKNPDVYVFDEPLSNLDARLRTDMRSRIISMHEQLNATFIYVTHDQVEAMTMADQIVILDDGIVMQVGTPQEVYNDPNNTFVAQFIGNPGMNLMPLSTQKGHWGYRAEDCEITTSGARDALITYHLGDNQTNIDMIESQSLNPKNTYQIESTIVTEEYMGSEILYTVKNIFGVQKVTSRDLISKDGESIYLLLAEEDLYYFDENGDRLR